MLVTITIIGILVAVSVPFVSNIRESSEEAYAKRNAQEAAAMSAAANVLGVDHVLAEVDGGVEATLEVLSEGIATPVGVKPEMIFVLKLDEARIPQIAQFLVLRENSSGVSMEYAP